MNERIRELADQVIVKYAASEQWVFTDEELDGFAELIIKECMPQIEEVRLIQTQIDPGPEYVQGFDDGMFVAIRTIEEHFGVEE